MVIHKEYKKNQLMIGSNGRKQKKHVFDWVNLICLSLFAIASIYPLIYVIAGSFNEGSDYINGGIWLFPRVFSFENYQVVLNDMRLWKSFGITIARTVLGTFLSVIYTAVVAYAMSRPNLIGKPIIYRFFIFTMFFGGGLIPYFWVINLLGLFDNFLVYIIPAMFSVYNMLVFVNFFKTIPEEIHESAVMDGASEFKIFFSIVLPLSGPVVSTIALWNAVGHWNSFFDTMIYTSNDNLWTLQYYLMKVIKESSMPASGVNLPIELLQKVAPETVSLAAIMISVIPIFILYPIILKTLTKGVVVGSLKG
ncbi:MAG: carbohydrate ABC transporter permease [Bacilli bacterium]|nr:carbohydrate ABC transporter permease [Erysipelotrichaceae bacterium]MDY4819646.1 carbohydrate ABC transporter permease [Bacilli bacterium]MDY5669425.1 carbohydrate ABC transporter permease [Bacilli bacterium]